MYTVTGTGAARTGEGASTPPSDTMGAATNVSWYDDMSGDSKKFTTPADALVAGMLASAV